MDETMIRELVNGLKFIYNDSLIKIILYGSVAKHTNTPESDIDIALILNTSHAKDYDDVLLDFVVDMNLKYDRVFSIMDIDLSEFEKWKDILPFYKNVKKDGVVLWKAA